MNQFSFHPASFLAADAAETAASSSAVGRILVVMLLAVTLTLAVRSLRLIWGPIAEIAGQLLRAGALAALAFTMLIVVVVVTIAFA